MKWSSQDPFQWHDHFAWWPVTVGGGETAWLRWVRRKAVETAHGRVWKYRMPRRKR